MKSPQSTVSMADKVALIDSLCAKARILPVITIAREQDILPLADALAAGGLTALEVTLRSEFGLKAIQVLREQRPELCTGAGTVLDRHMLEAATVAGSQFIVTPGITRDLLEALGTQPNPAAAGYQQRLRDHGRLWPGLSPLQAVPGGSQRWRRSHQSPGRPVWRSEILPDRRRQPGQYQELHGVEKRDVRGR